MILSPDTSSSAEAAVGAGSVTFSTTMVAGIYMFVSNVACWIAQGAAPTASAGAGSMYVPAGVVLPISGSIGAKLAVIEDSSGGKASLTHAITY